jgi:outer membrane lipopolysaccharide assembly protein LptE/RlpB
MKTNTVKKTLNTNAKKLVKVLAKEKSAKVVKTEEKTAKILSLKEKLSKRSTKPTEVSIFTNGKEQEKMARYGITAVQLIGDKDLGEEACEVRVDNDLVTMAVPSRELALSMATGLFAHIKAMAEKLSKRSNE